MPPRCRASRCSRSRSPQTTVPFGEDLQHPLGSLLPARRQRDIRHCALLPMWPASSTAAHRASRHERQDARSSAIPAEYPAGSHPDAARAGCAGVCRWIYAGEAGVERQPYQRVGPLVQPVAGLAANKQIAHHGEIARIEPQQQVAMRRPVVEPRHISCLRRRLLGRQRGNGGKRRVPELLREDSRTPTLTPASPCAVQSWSTSITCRGVAPRCSASPMWSSSPCANRCVAEASSAT